MNNMMKNNTLSYRVGQLEKVVEKLEGQLDVLRTNEIPHLEATISGLTTRVNVLATLNIAAIIMGLVFGKIWK